MDQKTKGNSSVKLWFVNLPVIRHVLSIWELLVIIYWRNYFGDGIFTKPDPIDFEFIYDLWHGQCKERIFYYPIIEPLKKNKKIGSGIFTKCGINYTPPTEEELEDYTHFTESYIPDAIYLRLDKESDARTVKIPFVEELKQNILPQNDYVDEIVKGLSMNQSMYENGFLTENEWFCWLDKLKTCVKGEKLKNQDRLSILMLPNNITVSQRIIDYAATQGFKIVSGQNCHFHPIVQYPKEIIAEDDDNL